MTSKATGFTIEELGEFLLPYKPFGKMTWQDKTDYCEKSDFGYAVADNGMLVKRKKFWCKHADYGPDGEPPCKICGPLKERKRRDAVVEKVTAAFDITNVLYMTQTENEAETKALLYRLRKRGGRSLSIPCNPNGGKLFLLDMFDEVTKPEMADQYDAVTSFSFLRNNTDWGYLSGNLKPSDPDDEDRIVTFIRPLWLTVAIDDELSNGVQTEAVLTIGVREITPENFERLIGEKLDLTLKILHECGYPDAQYSGEKEVSVPFRLLRDSWFSAQLRPVTTNSLAQYPRAVSWRLRKAADDGLAQLKQENRTYLARKQRGEL
jgi:hypothetical protein